MKQSIFAISAASLLAASPLSAQQDQVCMMAGEMRAALIDWYGELPINEPTENNEQIWASAETGTWTMLRMFSDGSACVIAQGEDWTTGTNQTDMLALVTD